MMRALLVLCGLLAGIGPARAGIYLTDEPPLLPLPTDFQPIRIYLIDFRSVPIEKVPEENPRSYRTYYRDRLAKLEAAQRSGLLTYSDHINLGACYLRVQRYRDAKAVLEAAERETSEDWSLRFLLCANLAATYHALAESEQQALYYDQAISYQRRALTMWPDLYVYWPLAGMGQHYRRAEVHFLRLLELRRDEQRRKPGVRTFEQVDDLFPGARFLNRAGEYEAGKIAWESWDKIPPDAPQIVLQLVYWMPYDDRLYWLLGEIYNARNHVREAHAILDELVSKRNLKSVRELNWHRRVLADAAELQEVLRPIFDRTPTLTLYLMATFAPRGASLAGPLGAAMVETSWPAVEYWYQESAKGPPQPPEPPIRPVEPRGQREWGAILGGVLLGILIGALGVWQVRQWRQRHAASLAQRRLSEE